VIVDADGEVLQEALAAEPDVVKPNAAEAGQFLGRPLLDVDDALAAARAVLVRGARAAVVSMGPDGGVACTPDGAFRFAPPYPVEGNPTGAGDALVAALARGLSRQDSWPDILRNAAAVSTAALAVPYAGGMDADLAARLRPLVTVTVI
jgi:tagatose 6-phosphate kinase